MFPLSKVKRNWARSLNSYSSKGHAYTCAWLLDCAVRTEKTFQYFLCAEPKIPTSDQHSEAGMQQCERGGNLKRGHHTRKTNKDPTPQQFSSVKLFTEDTDPWKK